MKRDRVRFIQQRLMGLHSVLYRATGGRVNGFPGTPIRFVFLTTTGRKSGEPRRVPLLYLPEGDNYIVVASNFGNAWFPAWWLNLEANPKATAETKRRIQVPVVAERITDPDEYETKWAQFTKTYRLFPKYRERAGRDIPIVRLVRTA
ncbi:MAG TPA: nitroreductase/quinone reductase family protein [Acidimicrobiia bacterium]|nr:nitroreductase/quinone reductase family protein [Acidimicrobiia bacterium]